MGRSCVPPTVRGVLNGSQMNVVLGQRGKIHLVKHIHAEKCVAGEKDVLGGVVSAVLWFQIKAMYFKIMTTGISGTACLVLYPCSY